MPVTAAAQVIGGAGSDVNVTDYGTVDLAVQDTDLGQVLQMLSMQSRKNIITSRSVSATVTANLYDVTFEEALQAILYVNGYDYIEEGNFIYVYTRAEIEEIRRAQRQTESRIYILEHLSASDAREFVGPLLSSDGQISHRGDVTAGFKPDINDGGADDYAYSAKIVVNDYVENLDAIAQLLRELDTPPQQVLVEATVLRTRLFEDNAFGIDFSVLGRVDFADFFTPFTAVDDLLFKGQPESEVDSTVGSPATADTGHRPTDGRARAITSRTTASGGLKLGVMQDNVSVFLRVLDEVTDSTVLARPKIMALNRQRAEVLVGEKVAYRSSTATETSVTQRVEFLDTGVSLSFRPFISRSGMIRLELQPKVSFATLRDTGDGDTLPDEFTNELTTNVRVRDGQTLILGGLFEEDIQKTRRQVPLLGDIPLLGTVFRGHEDRIRRNEIIFLITPTIIKDEVLWELGRDSLDMVEAARVGARQGLLPFSREKITTHYNQQAVEAIQRGRMRRAEYYINNSLRLKSDQPEMIRLRQSVTGKQQHAHESGVLERILRKRLGDDLPGDRPRSHDTRDESPRAPEDKKRAKTILGVNDPELLLHLESVSNDTPGTPDTPGHDDDEADPALADATGADHDSEDSDEPSDAEDSEQHLVTGDSPDDDADDGEAASASAIDSADSAAAQPQSEIIPVGSDVITPEQYHAEQSSVSQPAPAASPRSRRGARRSAATPAVSATTPTDATDAGDAAHQPSTIGQEPTADSPSPADGLNESPTELADAVTPIDPAEYGPIEPHEADAATLASQPFISPMEMYANSPLANRWLVNPRFPLWPNTPWFTFPLTEIDRDEPSYVTVPVNDSSDK